MMRLFVQLTLLISLVVIFVEAGKKGEWKHKKYNSKKAHYLTNSMDKNMGDMKGKDFNQDQDEPFHKRGKSSRQHMKKDKHHKRGKYGHKKHASWLNFEKDSECGIPCKHGEVCITGPIDTKPMCVRKKDLKKSLKLFHRYQKKEIKAWKRFHKEKYNGVDQWEEKKKNKKEHVASLKRQHLEKHNMGHLMGEHGKKADLKVLAPAVSKSDDPEECSTSQFAQMRTRMMGWFHLLHGQDHLAKKAHKGNIKSFYKHVSVKKELREHDGTKCECLKSAMWQFNQMDQNGDDMLTKKELNLLDENSLEPCIQPYLTSCDRNGDGNLSSDEWCCCFSNVVAPCFQKVDEIRRSGDPVTYMPRCDKEGYYMREQCTPETEGKYKCWCVDYNGNEFKGSHTVNGRAHCSKIALYESQKPPMV